jgi:hypothetical protein
MYSVQIKGKSGQHYMLTRHNDNKCTIMVRNSQNGKYEQPKDLDLEVFERYLEGAKKKAAKLIHSKTKHYHKQSN